MVIEITRVQFGLKIKSTGLSLEAMRQQKPTSCQTILVLKERKKYFWTDYSSIYVWITKLTQICPMVLEIISESLKFQIFLEEYALVPLCFIIGFQNV